MTQLNTIEARLKKAVRKHLDTQTASTEDDFRDLVRRLFNKRVTNVGGTLMVYVKEPRKDVGQMLTQEGFKEADSGGVNGSKYVKRGTGGMEVWMSDFEGKNLLSCKIK